MGCKPDLGHENLYHERNERGSDETHTCSTQISKIEENRQTFAANTTLLHDAGSPLLLLISLRCISCEQRLPSPGGTRSGPKRQVEERGGKRGERTRRIRKKDEEEADGRRRREMSRAKHLCGAKSSRILSFPTLFTL